MAGDGRKMTRRAFVACAGAVLAAAVSGWVAWGNKALEATYLRVASSALPDEFEGFRIAHVSDLHNDSFGAGNADLVGLLDVVAPDLIAVTGDLVDAYHTDFDVGAEFIEAAAQIAPVALVTGNHEARVARSDPAGYRRYEDRLINAGARVLHTTSYEMENSGACIRVAGIDDPSLRVPADDTALGLQEGVSAARLASMGLEGASVREGRLFTVLLAHRPELFETYAGAGIDLALTGHAHGGQFRLPFIGGLYAPNQGFFPRYDAGLYVRGGTTMAVSRGLGNSAFPFRINNRPELVVVELGR